jgi:hypothetical protein
MKCKSAIACGLFLVPLAFGQGVKPERGFVPDSKTAIKIAEAVLVPVYGEKQIDSEKPLIAKLQHDVWTVQGTLNCPAGEVCHGGVAVVEISKTDGRILSMTHYK